MTTRLGRLAHERPFVAAVTVLVVIGFLMLALIGRILAQSVSREAVDAQAKTLARTCDLNQVNRAWQRVRTREASAKGDDIAAREERLSDAYFRVVDCRRTYDGTNHRTVFLSRALDRCFVDKVSVGYFAIPGNKPTTDTALLRRIC
jgi:hypothetical protein